MNWELGKATDYFDNRSINCIWEYSQQYGRLSMNERPLVDLQIKNRIEGWLDQIAAYNDSLLPMVAGTIVDDIYRSVNLSYYFNDDATDYLNATAKVVTNWYKSHSMQIQYITNNTFSDMLRPLVVFPKYFAKTGLLYLCPQYCAWEMMKERGIPMEQFWLFYKDFASDAIAVTNELIRRSCLAGTHYIHLDIDAPAVAFEADFSYKSGKEQIRIIRQEDPQDSTRFEVV